MTYLAKCDFVLLAEVSRAVALLLVERFKILIFFAKELKSPVYALYANFYD
jgi:hypothetical protein